MNFIKSEERIIKIITEYYSKEINEHISVLKIVKRNLEEDSVLAVHNNYHLVRTEDLKHGIPEIKINGTLAIVDDTYLKSNCSRKSSGRFEYITDDSLMNLPKLNVDEQFVIVYEGNIMSSIETLEYISRPFELYVPNDSTYRELLELLAKFNYLIDTSYENYNVYIALVKLSTDLYTKLVNELHTNLGYFPSIGTLEFSHKTLLKLLKEQK